MFSELFALDQYLEDELFGYIKRGNANEALENLAVIYSPCVEVVMNDILELSKAQSALMELANRLVHQFLQATV